VKSSLFPGRKAEREIYVIRMKKYCIMKWTPYNVLSSEVKTSRG
jgi:hypothetical protein